MIDNIKSLGSLNLDNPTVWIFSFPLLDRAATVLFANMFLVRVSSMGIFKNTIYVDHINISMDDYVNKNGILVPETKVIGTFKAQGKNEKIEWYGFAPFRRNVSEFVEKDQPVLMQLFNKMVIELYARI